jgi:hypothetical protein
MELTLPLLGTINKNVAKDAPLRQRYLVRVTAERLAQLLVCERRGKRKSDPFRILPESTIRIDSKIQRGVDSQGFHLQQPSKILDIAATLLGSSASTVPRVYLGTLIWNVREQDPFVLVKKEVEGRPPEWELTINTEAIYLTDSAHRHLGIVEAYKAFMADKAKYPKFRPNFEFAVELYNLDHAEEKELFAELNAKQKKITAAKQKEMDVSSPIGALKDAIVAYDKQSEKLLDNNIEVSSNKNDKHTLMTMSVFVSSIGEVFTMEQIRKAREDEEVRDEYAAYYCEFLYKLSKTLVVRYTAETEREVDAQPFTNLWLEFIRPEEDSYDEAAPASYEEKLDKARLAATRRNQSLRKVDIANHNGTIKALFRLAGVIRAMPHWEQVIDRLQTDLNLPADGKFFQRTNPALFSKENENDVPIASLNEDGSINLQVQTKNISKLHRYLRRELGLELHPIVQLRRGQGEWSSLRSGGDATGHWNLLRDGRNLRVVQVLFYGVKGDVPSDEVVSLSVVPSFDWKDGTFKGQRKIVPAPIRLDESYEHPNYQDIVRYSAIFELNLPVSPAVSSGTIKLEFKYPDLDGSELKTDISFSCTSE